MSAVAAAITGSAYHPTYPQASCLGCVTGGAQRCAGGESCYGPIPGCYERT
eukprot:COSAG04_NODE_203_length_20431_cov_12.598269_18_plen_51_part_00